MSSSTDTPDGWNPGFYLTSPCYDVITRFARQFDQFKAWPDLSNYNQLLQHYHPGISSQSGAALRFVSQAEKPACINDEYEVRISKSGDIQTRLENWHDFFQVMTWCTFPETKKLINHLHSDAMVNRRMNSNNKQRSPVENALTLFDECGAIIVTGNNYLTELIKNHRWKELFLTNRDAFSNQIKAFIFGHALYEKALAPYIGMTAHGIIIEAKDDFFTLCIEDQCRLIDSQASTFLAAQSDINTRLLQPFPVLGIPGWHSENHNASFYKQKKYFREKRS